MRFMIGLLFCFHANATEGWFCETESGKRDGGTIWACGVGEAGSEADARKQALRAALEEFKTICEASSECRNRPTIIEPKRLTCVQKASSAHTKGDELLQSFGIGNGWKCYRLVAITLGN